MQFTDTCSACLYFLYHTLRILHTVAVVEFFLRSTSGYSEVTLIESSVGAFSLSLVNFVLYLFAVGNVSSVTFIVCLLNVASVKC